VSRHRARLTTALVSAIVSLTVAEFVARGADGDLDFPDDGRRFATRGGRHGTNAEGFHDRERAEAPGPGVRRVVVLGDSMTWGTGTAEQAWPRIAESRLGGGWEVLNLSHYGYDAEQALATLGAFGLRYQPDAVVFATYGNDLVPTELITVGDDAVPAWIGRSALGPLAGRSSVLRRIEGAVRARGFEAREDVERYRAALAAMRSCAEGAGIPLSVVVLHPHVLADPDLTACDRRAGIDGRCADALRRAGVLTGVAAQLGLPVYDTIDALRAGRERAWFPSGSTDWEHPSPEGHTLLGEAIGDWLKGVLPSEP
jgi:lysophospholipase L1-like esterase